MSNKMFNYKNITLIAWAFTSEFCIISTAAGGEFYVSGV